MSAQEDGVSQWSVIGLNQWQNNAEPDVRHLLVKSGTTYKELHGRWVHTYKGPSLVAEPLWPLGNPNTMDPENPTCKWVSTEERSSEPPGTIAQVLAWLASLIL